MPGRYHHGTAAFVSDGQVLLAAQTGLGLGGFALLLCNFPNRWATATLLALVESKAKQFPSARLISSIGN